MLSPDRPLFDKSIEAIESIVLEEHRNAFQHVDVSLLLDELRSIATRNGPGDRALIACSRKFVLFVQTFAHYFSVLDICTQVRAEWPGLLWGLVRLIFQVRGLRYDTQN